MFQLPITFSKANMEQFSTLHLDFATSLLPADAPLLLRCDAIKGRHFVAARAIKENEVLLEEPAFLTAVLPTHRKRVCHRCLTDSRTRLQTVCNGCFYAHYCDSHCRAADLDDTPGTHDPTEQQPSQMHPGEGGAQGPGRIQPLLHVPHRLLCPVLKQFSSFKQDADMQAILIMCLEGLARQHLKLGSSSTDMQHLLHSQPQDYESSTGAHCSIVSQELLLLLSHMRNLPAKEQLDWSRGARFLITAMQRAGWPGPIPTEELIVSLCGRVLANNFGIFSPPVASSRSPLPELSEALDAKLAISTQDAHSQGAAMVLLPLSTPGPPAAQLPASSSSFSHAQSSTQQLSQVLQQGATPVAPGTSSSALPQPKHDDRICHPQRNMRAEMTGRQLFITTSFFNHSCSPNAEVQGGGSRDGPFQVLALHDIAMGEECSITYLDLDLPRATRQTTLNRLFNFTCHCKRCEEELVNGSDKVTYARSAHSEGAEAMAARARTAAAANRARERLRKGGSQSRKQGSGKKGDGGKN